MTSLPARPQPALGIRNDGLALLYTGKVNYLSGASEAGKTWFALMVAAQLLAVGAGVVFLDFEDDEHSVRGMLAALGVPFEAQRELFFYMAPRRPPTSTTAPRLLEELPIAADLVIFDGMTELMAIQGHSPLDATHVAETFRLFRDFAEADSGVLVLDHVTKSDPAGRYPIGSQHKLAAVTGAALVMQAQTPFGEGKAGMSNVLVAKDRPGGLRRHAVAGIEELPVIAQMVVSGDSHFSLRSATVA